MTSVKHEVVVVGGGTGGITVAARLRRADRGLDVAVIEPRDTHDYQPLWTLVGGGIVDKRITRRPMASVIPPGVDWIRESVESFDPANDRLTTKEGTDVEYDWLVVSPGMQIDWGAIDGLDEAIGTRGVVSNYAYEYADKTWEAIRSVEKGRALFTMPATPIKCGGAPQKIMYLAEDYFRRQGLRDRVAVTFASAGKQIFGVPKYRATLERIVRERGIETAFRHDLEEIRADAHEAVFRNLDTDERVTLDYAMIHVTPPMSAPDFIKRSPLANEAGWVDVDKYTTQHTRYPNVFALGDASSLPTSRTGAAIRKEAPVLVHNLLAAKNGMALDAKYDGYSSCPIVTGYGRLVLAEFDYDGNPAETFPFDQSKERRSMYLLKRYGLPAMYWHGMLRGLA